jgi:hypothetical protein
MTRRPLDPASCCGAARLPPDPNTKSDKALEQSRSIPVFIFIVVLVSRLCAVRAATSGDKAAAAWEAEEIRALQPGFSGRSWVETHPLDDIAQKKKLLQALGTLGF